MEFLAGIIFTLVTQFIGYKGWQMYQRRKQRESYIPPSSPTPKDFVSPEDRTRTR